MLDSSALGNQAVLFARASTTTLPLGILKISRLGPVSISSLTTLLVWILLLSHMPSRLSIKHAYIHVVGQNIYTSGIQLLVHGLSQHFPSWGKQPQPAICRPRSGLRNVDRPHGVVGGGRWEVGGTQPLCPSGPSMSLMRQSHARGILTS